MANLEKVQQRLADEAAKYNALQKEYQKVVGLRQQLDAQLNENSVVKEVHANNTRNLTNWDLN